MPLFLQLQSGAKAASHEGDADEDLLLLLQCCGGATHLVMAFTSF